MRALLDTHILLWWFDGGSRLSQAQAQVLSEAKDGEEPLWVADITLWEIANLTSLGRVELRLPLLDWLERATAPPLVRRLPITPAVATEVASLPPDFHRDPADRLIVASARVLGATLLTQDRRIIDSGVVPTLS